MTPLKLLFTALAFVILPGCVKLTLAWADLTTKGQAASPAVLGEFNDTGPVMSIDDWESVRAPMLREALQEFVYGRFPNQHSLNVLSRKVLDEAAFDGAGRLVEYQLQADLSFGGAQNLTDVFYMDVIMPLGVEDAPIILIQSFCPRWNTIPHPSIYRPEGVRGCDGNGIANAFFSYVFGRYIATPPIEDILARGYGIATVFPSEFAPDSREEGLTALADLSAGLAPDAQRWGTIAAWAWGFSLMVDALEQDNEWRGRKLITWGHSRYGKSALLAAAFDDRIDGVIAHQSGTGGASLNRRKKGESIEAITQSFPHWFAKRYGEYAAREDDVPIDQHHLLALIAPRPVLLGNARRDVWSDPNGAFRAAMGADPVYELYGDDGLKQNRLDQWTPDASLAFWIRPGTHGVVKEDWPAFLEFMDAHFQLK